MLGVGQFLLGVRRGSLSKDNIRIWWWARLDCGRDGISAGMSAGSGLGMRIGTLRPQNRIDRGHRIEF
jgi:hypothetical protein